MEERNGMPGGTLQLRGSLLGLLKELGADLAGVAAVDALRDGPSEQMFPLIGDHVRDRFSGEITTGLPHGAVFWEEDAESVIIFAVAHPEDRPEMDWWCGELDPPGNRELTRIAREFRQRAEQAYPGLKVYPRRYHVERGGLYLKDAAVQAGLGCLGRNNLLVTPEFGPRVRLRAMTVNVLLPPTGPAGFDPCAGCGAPCLSACPQQAFAQTVYTEAETGLRELPGRDGRYRRAACGLEMERNEAGAQTGCMPEICSEPRKIIKYCRNCELACPAGNGRGAKPHSG